MSRAITIDLPIADVRALCEKQGYAISTIETLPVGLTRLVLKSTDAAEAMRRKLGKRVVVTHVERTSLMPRGRGAFQATPAPQKG